jgi:hypothetical protein
MLLVAVPVAGHVPPETEIAWLYATPTDPVGNVVVTI